MEQKQKFDAIIIGAGPAGIMAAIRASQRDKKVLLIERNYALGKKILMSGNTRCNLTNLSDVDDFLEKFSRTKNFLKNTFAQFFNTDLINFFEKSHLKLKIEDGNRVFPKSDDAKDVLGVLKEYLKNKNIKIIFGERVRDIIFEDNIIKGVVTYSNNRFYSEHMAICTGGISYHECGSTGDGYELAKKLGHSIVELKPALVPVEIKEKFTRDWQGVSLKDVILSVYKQNKKITQKRGDIIFTHFGLSGPAILDLSADVYDMLKLDSSVTLSINFKPDLSYQELNEQLLKEFQESPNRELKNMLKNFIPHKLIKHFLEYCALSADKKANQITSQERKRLMDKFFDFRLTVKATRPKEEAIITRGGVDINQINPKTMESKLIKGLFFAGEVIDIDAKTGGFNMQAAFSTGWVCGNNL